MALFFLCNTVGRVATSAGITFGSAVPGSNALDAVSGPRNRKVRGSSGAASHRYRYDCPSTEVTHVVVSRMDLFKNTLDADNVVVEYGPGNTTDSTTQVEDMALVGPTGQDWVKPISRTSTAFGVLFNSSAITREFEYGKVYFSKAFSFGKEPQFGVGMGIRRSERVESLQPCLGYKPYAVEADFGLTFSGVTLAKLLEFEALPLGQPVFLYDDAGDVLHHRLEHAILARPWSWVRRSVNWFDLTLTLSRLAHYP